MKLQSLVFAASLLAAAAAQAQDRPPDWIRRPSLNDIQAVWPRQALKEGYGGKAVISCIVTVQGSLRGCHVVEESPEGGGFGGAALALSSQFMMKPAMKAGAPVEATVRIPIAFPKPDKQTGSRIKPSTDTDFEGDRIFASMPWRQAPSYAEVLAAYPAKAKAQKLSGGVTLDCRIGKDGGLSACQPLNETPTGYGFAAAARTLTDRFVGPTADAKGASIAGSRVHLRVSFAAEALSATGAPVIGRPEWRSLPSMQDFTAVIPPAARAAKIYKARVVMLCDVAAEGALGGCKVQSEDPVDLGYGGAALTLAQYFRVSVWTDEGLPTIGGALRVPLRFDLEEAMAGKP